MSKLRTPLRGTVRKCLPQDIDAIYLIINEAARAYKPVLAQHVYHEPQMPSEELQKEFKRVKFLAYEENSKMLGVMGYEYVEDVALIRHAYIRPGEQGKGIGSLLLDHIENSITLSKKAKRIVIGTYARAFWAISFYEKHGYKRSSNPQEILVRYYDIPEVQRLNSLTLEKNLSLQSNRKFSSFEN